MTSVTVISRRCPRVAAQFSSRGANAAEVDVEAGAGPWLGTAVAVEQDQRPGADVAGGVDGQFGGAAVDSAADRQGAVIFQKFQVGEASATRWLEPDARCGVATRRRARRCPADLGYALGEVSQVPLSPL